MMRMTKILLPVSAVLGVALALLSISVSQAATVWSDGFAVSADTSNMNLETAARQSGPLAPIDYVANTPDVTNDYHHQMFAVGTNPTQPLQLAGDGGLPTGPPIFALPTMVSPNHNFVGFAPGGIVGKRITFDLDVAAIINDPTGGSFVQAGITLGSSSPLIRNDEAGAHFGIRAIEDTFNGNGAFLQFFEGDTLVQNLVSHTAGNGTLSMQLDIDDLGDGNPWDGVGSTTISVSVNGSPVGTPHTIGAGGLTSNYITLSGDRDFNGNDLVTHLFDNLTVHALPIPEPTGMAIMVSSLSCLGFLRRRR